MPDFVTLLSLLGQLAKLPYDTAKTRLQDSELMKDLPAWLQYNLGAEPGKGLRPQSDEALRYLIGALKNDPTSAKIVQKALRTPGTIKVDMGGGTQSAVKLDRMMHDIATGGTTRQNQYGSAVNLYPDQIYDIGRAYGTNAAKSVTPHELIHAIRFNRGFDTGNANIEESIPRVALGAPMNQWAYRKFGPEEPVMTPADMQMLKDMFGETLK